jgi:hypothetical protein
MMLIAVAMTGLVLAALVVGHLVHEQIQSGTIEPISLRLP